MRRLINRPILLAVASFIGVWGITGGIAYGATVFSKSLNASVNIVAEASFSFYADEEATELITEVTLPDASPGETSTFVVYVKNTGPATETISAGSNTVATSIGTLTLRFDGQTQRELAPGAISRVVGKLRVSDDAPAGGIDFVFSVNAVPATGTGTEPPPTQGPSGQVLFSTYCVSCHVSGPPNTSRTQAQLQSFIANHQTGNNLTAEEVAAIAAFIKS